MALVLADRVQETSTTSGTGSITLAGAVAGFQTFAVVGNGNTTYYTIVDGTAWEVGIGTYSTSGPTLARTTVLSNSNGNTSPITLSGGSSSVFLTYPAEKSINLDASNNASPLGTIASGTWQGSTVGVAYGGTGVTASSGANSVVLRDASQNIAVNRLNQANTSVTAAGGTTALTAASTYSQTLNGTGGQTFSMPDATTLATGVAFIFNNNATGTLTLTDYASATVGTITPGGACELVLLANGTVGGTWDVHGFLPENVTWGTNALALGGTVITGGTWQGGTITSAYGGTGLTTFTGANNALYSTGASTLTAGILPVAAGGTGVGSYTANGVLYASGAGTITNGSALTFDGTNLSVGSAGASGDRYVSMVNSTGNSTFGTYGGSGYGSLTSGDAYTYTGKNIVLMADDAAASIKFSAGGSTERMRLNSTGLGIGTSAPATKLDIRGTSNTAASTIQIIGNTVSTLLLGQNADGGVIRGQGANNVLAFWTGGTGDTGAGQSGTERARIDGSGRLVIGSTTANAKLNVNTTTYTAVTNGEQALIEGTTAWQQGLAFSMWGAGTYNSGYASGYIGVPNTENQLYISGGAAVIDNPASGGWAKALNSTSASFLIVGRGGASFYGNSGLTANTAYTPTERITINSSGQLILKSPMGDGIAPLQITPSSSSGSFQWASTAISSSLGAGQTMVHFLGNATSAGNAGYVGFNYAGAGSASNYVSLGHYANDNILRVYYGTYTQSFGSMRAPLFYDSDDTTYYGNFAGTSNLYDLQITGASQKYIYINPGNGYEAMVRYNGGTGSSWYVGKRVTSQLVGTESFHFYSEALSATAAGIDTAGNTIAYSSMRSPIFYERDDTAYYGDFASTSNSAFRIRGGALFGPNTSWGEYLAVGSNGNGGTSYASVATTDGNLHLDSKSGSSMYLNYYAGTNIYFCNSNTIKGTFDSSGNLTVNGNVTAYSDERLKKDWSALSSNFVEQLAQVQSGTYTRIDSGERQVGVGAQSLQAILKEAVSDKDEYLGVHYGHAALASSVELAKYVTALEQRISQLEMRL
jgi:hypothetical protein